MTNDCAERGIKLISEYADSLTRDSVVRQNIIQVVERHRKMYPNVNKTTLAKQEMVKRRDRRSEVQQLTLKLYVVTNPCT